MLDSIEFSATNTSHWQTYSTLQSFFLAMSLNQDIQKKAQTEIDLVVGPDRLPTHNDRNELPFVNAIVKESLRWHTVVPLGVPHLTTEDIVYRGYFIPAGSILLPNSWFVSQNIVTVDKAAHRGWTIQGLSARPRRIPRTRTI